MPPPSIRRTLLALLASAAVFALLAYPCAWLRLPILREFYILLETVGIMGGPNAPLGGQILRHNYYRNPAWAHYLAGAAAAAIAFAPALIASIVTLRAIRRTSRLTLCSHCGVPLHNLTAPRCPRCGHAF